jgi:hypothetical protein
MSPKLSFHSQPGRKGDAAGAFVGDLLSDPKIDRVTMVVAWARFSGLGLLEKEIRAFQRRGGRLRIIVGIDQGIATVPGLTLVAKLADEAFVFHNSKSTFHPKLYLGEGKSKAGLLVGSSNLTAGGLFGNYEAGLGAEFSLPGEAAEPALVEARDYVARLIADKAVCLRLTKTLIKRLEANPRYAISHRERRSPAARRRGSSGEKLDETAETGEAGEAIFGASKHRRTAAPKLSGAAAKELAKFERKKPSGPPPAAPVPVGGKATPVATWTKELSPSDAQHPPSKGSKPSHAIGNVRLVEAGNPIDWRVWFRHDLFAAATWNEKRDRNRNKLEVAVVTFDVTIDGKSFGRVDLRVDHAPHRESGQDNHATILHWDSLSPLLRKKNYTGYVLTLQRMSDGSYRLDVSP